ncbi:MAG TPA: MlaD family protein [Stellaceae bacterium]|nr:MlaD family protein [Stellaceae bacterium]
METRAHYVAVGAFVLTMIVLAFAAVLWLGRAELTTQFAKYHIYFKGPVTGLSRDATVDYSGVPVGKVAEIRLTPDQQIEVTVEIEADVAIKTNDRASVETNILSGVSYIQIGGGTKEAALLVAKPGEVYPVIRPRYSGLASVTARAPQLLEQVTKTLDQMNELLDDKNRRAVAETLENVRVFSSGLADRKKEIGELVDNANSAAHSLSVLLDNVDTSYSGPDGLGDRAAAAIADFDRLAKNLSDTNKQLQATLQDVRPGVRTFSQQTLSDVGSLVGEARQLISGLNRLTATIERDPSRVLFGDRREGYRPK